jgi:hypothetical protein
VPSRNCPNEKVTTAPDHGPRDNRYRAGGVGQAVKGESPGLYLDRCRCAVVGRVNTAFCSNVGRLPHHYSSVVLVNARRRMLGGAEVEPTPKVWRPMSWQGATSPSGAVRYSSCQVQQSARSSVHAPVFGNLQLYAAEWQDATLDHMSSITASASPPAAQGPMALDRRLELGRWHISRLAAIPYRISCCRVEYVLTSLRCCIYFSLHVRGSHCLISIVLINYTYKGRDDPLCSRLRANPHLAFAVTHSSPKESRAYRRRF